MAEWDCDTAKPDAPAYKSGTQVQLLKNQIENHAAVRPLCTFCMVRPAKPLTGCCAPPSGPGRARVEWLRICCRNPTRPRKILLWTQRKILFQARALF